MSVSIKTYLLLASIFVFQSSYALSITFSCGPHGKNGADVDQISISGKGPKEATDTILISANPAGGEIGQDEVVTTDNISHKMSCSQQ